MEPNDVLLDVRRAAELSQEEFAEQMDWTQPFQSQLETGDRPIHKHALAIAKKFRAQMDELGYAVEDLLRGTRPRKRRGTAA